VQGDLGYPGGRVFKPEQIIFAPTSRCNLACAHCRVRRGPEELSEAEAVSFLERCSGGSIERVGFSGGEPFLRPEFLQAVSRAAVKHDFYFDRLMTNGVWFNSKQELESVLSGLYDAGFDGTFGVSVDAYHDQESEKLALFFESVFRIWSRKDCAEILSVRSPDETQAIVKLRDLARLLGGELVLEGDEPAAIAAVHPNPSAPFGEELRVAILRFPYSASAEEGAWGSTRWFKDDFCEGPGNVFYVHPNGSIAVCCGFSNENPELIIGNIRDDDYESLLRRAGESSFVRLCYEKGLDARRRELEAAGTAFPGKTEDICFFCDWLCKHEARLAGC
jgi:MoaA/NifB/PqqE/SkfB family radical SAM enzyme